MAAIIELIDADKEFLGNYVLKKVNFSVNHGEFVTLLGPSGSGKTTVLRVLAGFEWLTRGVIKFKGQDIKDLEPHKRDISTIFQDYALFPHLNVEGNIRFGLKRLRVQKERVNLAAEEKLASLQYVWAQKASSKIEALKKLQNSLKLKATNTNSVFLKKYWQSKVDDLDFKFSFWTNYVDLKTKQFRRRHLTRKLTKSEIQKKVLDIVEIVGLKNQEHKNIDEISGGMKQRVALARSLVIEPEVLLLDEPLSALDAKIRETMRAFLRSIQRNLQKTFIFVTHDREEALEISDRIAIIRDGRIEQFDTPLQIYDYPKNKWVATFIGDANIFSVTVTSIGKVSLLEKEVSYDSLDSAYTKFVEGQRVDCCIRPEDIVVSRTSGYYTGEVTFVSYKGSYYFLNIKHGDTIFLVETNEKFEVGERVNISFDQNAVHLMEPETIEKT